jgi:diaminopimelate epimerase
MHLNFIKMQGAGNDYIYFDCLEKELENPEKVAKMLSKRHFSVGSDGIVLVCRSKIADAKMRIFNADGSEAKMCGNAARCVGKLLFESNFVRKSHITLETESGVRDIFLTVRNGKIEKITVDMGVAVVGDMFSYEALGSKFEMRAINVGNDHQVALVPDVDFLDLERIGRACEKNPRFPDGVNSNFCEMIEKNHLKVRVFERGSGETLACGTGACACAVAGIATGACEFGKTIKISMRGGDLSVFCDENHHVYLTGDAHVAFHGEVCV